MMVNNYKTRKQPIGIVLDISNVTRTYMPALMEICRKLVTSRSQDDVYKINYHRVAAEAYKEILIDIFSLYDGNPSVWKVNVSRSQIYLDLAGLGDLFGTTLMYVDSMAATSGLRSTMVTALRAIEYSMMEPLRDAIMCHISHYVDNIECIVADNYDANTLIVKVFPL